MISFACETISLEDMIRCSLNLNKTEYNVLLFLLRDTDKYRISKISKELKLDRTTVQKALKKLFEEKLVNRTQKNLTGGGYTFLYKVRDKQEIKSKLKEIIKIWCKSAEKAIDNW